MTKQKEINGVLSRLQKGFSSISETKKELGDLGVVLKVGGEIDSEVECCGGTFDEIDPDYLQYLNKRFKAVEDLV